jgi:uncharacterized protein with ATP-grasp and redox domains
MDLHADCLACIARGALDSARLATDDEKLHFEIMQQVFTILGNCRLDVPPPLMALVIQKAVARVTGCTDPYRKIKKQYNDLCLDLYPDLVRKAAGSGFEIAVRLCIAGNIIDFGIHGSVGKQKVLDTIDESLSMQITGNVSLLEKACKESRNILWIADNAGEIVFDRLVLEKLDPDRVTYAVRGGPTQNDATVEDAHYTGIADFVRVIDTGAAIPGIVLDHCSAEFRTCYEKADLIVSKGQGNFETLDMNDDRIFFVFKAKCPVVAACAGCSLNDMVIKNTGLREKFYE